MMFKDVEGKRFLHILDQKLENYNFAEEVLP